MVPSSLVPDALASMFPSKPAYKLMKLREAAMSLAGEDGNISLQQLIQLLKPFAFYDGQDPGSEEGPGSKTSSAEQSGDGAAPSNPTDGAVADAAAEGEKAGPLPAELSMHIKSTVAAALSKPFISILLSQHLDEMETINADLRDKMMTGTTADHTIKHVISSLETIMPRDRAVGCIAQVLGATGCHMEDVEASVGLGTMVSMQHFAQALLGTCLVKPPKNYDITAALKWARAAVKPAVGVASGGALPDVA